MGISLTNEEVDHRINSDVSNIVLADLKGHQKASIANKDSALDRKRMG